MCQQSFKSETTTAIRGPAWLRLGFEPNCGTGRERLKREVPSFEPDHGRKIIDLRPLELTVLMRT